MHKGYPLGMRASIPQVMGFQTLLHDMDRPNEAESLMRWAMAIGEQSFEPRHPTVANRLNNLAQLPRDTKHGRS